MSRMEQSAEPGIYEFQNFRNQYFAVFSANLLGFSHGCNVGWVTPALLLLRSDDSPLESGPITLEQLSWIGSMNCIGAVFGTFTSGYAAGRIGCKRTMAILAVPAICYWLTIKFANTVNYLIFARFLAGWTGGGIVSITALYVAEIAEAKIRGRLGSVAQVSRNSGMLTAFILGALLDYHLLPFIFITIPIAYLMRFMLLPNTPQHLVKRGKFEKAEKSLKFYKGCTGDSADQSTAISVELERMKSLAIERQANKKLHLKDIYERNALKALLIGVVLSFLNQLTGVFTFLTYAGNILSETGTSDFDPYISSIVLGVFQLAGPLLTSSLADKMGRKKVMIVSLLGSAVGQTALAVFAYLQKLNYELSSFAWVPVASMAFIIFIGALGVVPLSTLCTLEILPRKIRTFGMTFTTITLNLSAFFMSKLFPIWCQIIQLYGCLALMAGGCILGTIFVIMLMEETKGRDLDSISVSRPAAAAPVSKTES